MQQDVFQHVDYEQIKFAYKIIVKTKSMELQAREFHKELINKKILIWRGGQVYTVQITDIDVDKPDNPQIYTKCLQTNTAYDFQPNRLTRFIKDPNSKESVKFFDSLIYGSTRNTKSGFTKDMEFTPEQWEQLFASKLDTKGCKHGVYLITGTIEGVLYYYIGKTDRELLKESDNCFELRFKEHYVNGLGGRYSITTDMLLQAEDGFMQCICTGTDNELLETVFIHLFEKAEVKVINRAKTRKKISTVRKLVLDNRALDVEYVDWKPYDEVLEIGRRRTLPKDKVNKLYSDARIQVPNKNTLSVYAALRINIQHLERYYPPYIEIRTVVMHGNNQPNKTWTKPVQEEVEPITAPSQLIDWQEVEEKGTGTRWKSWI